MSKMKLSQVDNFNFHEHLLRSQFVTKYRMLKSTYGQSMDIIINKNML